MLMVEVDKPAMVVNWCRLFSASGFHGGGFHFFSVCGENPAGTGRALVNTGEHSNRNSAGQAQSRRGFRIRSL